jgi:hypothetical protein
MQIETNRQKERETDTQKERDGYRMKEKTETHRDR